MHFRKIEDKIARPLEFFTNVIKLKRAFLNPNLELPGYLDRLVKQQLHRVQRTNRNAPAILKKFFISVKTVALNS